MGVIPLPKPTSKKKVCTSVQLDPELYRRVKEAIHLENITLRQAIEYGLEVYLASVQSKIVSTR